jgi:adenylate kinase family enzyme
VNAWEIRIAIFGNSGSGKSTLARGLSARHNTPMLDLDTVVWEPGKIAVMRPLEAARADVERFLTTNPQWIVEGCYGELIELALPRCTEAIFLNPGLAACLANNRQRPWEPHKYESREAQDTMLEPLLAWVAGYYTRGDEWSYAYHRRVFDAFAGRKTELTEIEG